MKKVAALFAIALLAVVVVCWSGKADARPQYKKVFEGHYKDSKIADAVKKEGCNVCHVGKDRKNRNDFGKALEKNLSKDKFDELKSDEGKLKEHVEKALAEAEKEKNKDGETFGDRIKAGKLPGTNPPEAK